MTIISTITSTSKLRDVVLSGNTTRARKFPKGSCCQFIKCFSGLMFNEYDNMGVRQCAAGRSLNVCGDRFTGLSYS
jgi:hypothetical protein